MAEYDTIAQEYQASTQLAFREHVERYTLFELLGDVGEKSASIHVVASMNRSGC